MYFCKICLLHLYPALLIRSSELSQFHIDASMAEKLSAKGHKLLKIIWHFKMSGYTELITFYGTYHIVRWGGKGEFSKAIHFLILAGTYFLGITSYLGCVGKMEMLNLKRRADSLRVNVWKTSVNCQEMCSVLCKAANVFKLSHSSHSLTQVCILGKLNLELCPST